MSERLTEMLEPKAPARSEQDSAWDDQYSWLAIIGGLLAIAMLTAIIAPEIKRHIREARADRAWHAEMAKQDREMAKLIAQMERESERSKQIAREIQAIKAGKVAQ